MLKGGSLRREGMVYIGLLPKASLSIDEVHCVGGGGVPEVMVPGDVEVGSGGGVKGEGQVHIFCSSCIFFTQIILFKRSRKLT